jgi:hypothetical protein
MPKRKRTPVNEGSALLLLSRMPRKIPGWKKFTDKNAFDPGHVVSLGGGVFSSHHRGRREAMNLKNNLGTAQIKDVIEAHPRIGEILNKYEIGCVTCGVGICLLGDVVAIHALGAEVEAKIETEINEYLDASV